MLPPASYACSALDGAFVCDARTTESIDLYHRLGVRIASVLSQMQGAGWPVPILAQNFTPGRMIGAQAAVAVQTVIGSIAAQLSAYGPQAAGLLPPPPLQSLISPGIAPEQIIATIASGPAEILAYIDQVLMRVPQIWTMRPPPPEAIPMVTPSIFTLQGALALGAGIVTIGGLAWLAYSADQRLAGKIDRMGLLDDDGDDGDDGDDEGELPPGVIDAESSEVATADS